MAILLQLGFADYEQTYAKRKTRRQIFLEQMEATLPWGLFLFLIRLEYHQPSTRGGRPPLPMQVMLRIHLLQQWCTLFDPLMEEMLIDTPCFRCFAGIDKIDGPIPDEIMILDAIINNPLSSTKNETGERDPEIHFVAVGNQWFFGMRCHIGVDADSGHIGIEKRDGFKDCGAQMRIAMKLGQRWVLRDSPEGRLLDLVESAKPHLRAKVEHPFRIIKCQFGFRKLYYQGIGKNDLKLKMLFTLANLWVLRERCPCNA